MVGSIVVSCCQLSGSEHQPWLDLLRLFAYGTFSDYKGQTQTTTPSHYRYRCHRYRCHRYTITSISAAVAVLQASSHLSFLTSG